MGWVYDGRPLEAGEIVYRTTGRAEMLPFDALREEYDRYEREYPDWPVMSLPADVRERMEEIERLLLLEESTIR